MNFIYQRFLQIKDYQDCDARIETDGFPIELGFLSKNSSIETFSQEIKPIGTDECECHYPEEGTFLPFFLNPQTFRTLLQGKKMAIFWMESLLKG